MTWFGVVGDRFNREGVVYMPVGELETQDYGKAIEAATRYAESHPNAASQILRNGDPYLWVHHSYDLGTDQTTVRIKDCVNGHEQVLVNGRVVRDTRDHDMPSVCGWQLGEV